MRYNITVDVPYGKKLAYTLYSKGFLTDVPHVDENSDFVHFKYAGGSVIVLFYTFERFRRAYIATGWESEKDGEAVSLPGIDEKLCLIFTARGRKVDHLKRCVWLLTQEDEYKVFKFPLLFWYRLAFLIQFCGAKRSDVMYIYEKFKRHGGRKK